MMGRTQLTRTASELKNMPKWELHAYLRNELNRPDFYHSHTRKTMGKILEVLYPDVVAANEAGRAFMGMTKARMYRHLIGYAILKQINVRLDNIETAYAVTKKWR